jgi:hypothetical protein
MASAEVKLLCIQIRRGEAARPVEFPTNAEFSTRSATYPTRIPTHAGFRNQSGASCPEPFPQDRRQLPLRAYGLRGQPHQRDPTPRGQ